MAEISKNVLVDNILRLLPGIETEFQFLVAISFISIVVFLALGKPQGRYVFPLKVICLGIVIIAMSLIVFVPTDETLPLTGRIEDEESRHGVAQARVIIFAPDMEFIDQFAVDSFEGGFFVVCVPRDLLANRPTHIRVTHNEYSPTSIDLKDYLGEIIKVF